MPALRRKQPSAAKSRFHYTAVMYGLKAVPFREASFSATCKAVKRRPFTARLLNPCPSSKVFPRLLRSVTASCAVQIGQLRNLIWTSLKFSRPGGTKCVSPGSHTRARCLQHWLPVERTADPSTASPGQVGFAPNEQKIKPTESISISSVHFTLNLPQASRLLGMTKGRVGVPIEDRSTACPTASRARRERLHGSQVSKERSGHPQVSEALFTLA
jgi:hypothetical protein